MALPMALSMSRTPIIGGNWKMNLTLAGAQALSTQLRNTLGSHRACQVVVFPPFPYLEPARRVLRDGAIEVGAQDLHPKARGAFTSGVSAEMLTSMGVTRVLVGHSERRAWFGDTDAAVAEKLGVALSAGLAPVLCVGETLAERNGGQTFDVLARQLDSALRGHGPEKLSSLVLAYEPVWAIGTGVTATPGQAEEAHAFLRGHLTRTHGAAFAGALRIQYGGSVTADNAAELLACPNIDGALVGGASLDAVGFRRIVWAGSARGPR
jgi:triosephosphate isomerase